MRKLNLLPEEMRQHLLRLHRERCRRYRIKHPTADHDYYRRTHPKFVKKTPDEIRARRRLYRAKWYARSPHFHKNTQMKRRALIKLGVDCSQKISELHKSRFCHWCCVSLTDENRTIDHVIPLIRFGMHHPDNLVASCRRCNLSKNDKLVEEWTWKLAA